MKSLFISLQVATQEFISYTNQNSYSDSESNTSVWTIIIPAFSVLALIVGWFINSFFRHKENILIEQLKYRMKSIDCCIDFLYLVEKNEYPTNDDNYKAKLEEAKRLLFYYGNNNEYETFLQLEKALENEHVYDREAINKITNRLRTILQSTIKRTLKLS